MIESFVSEITMLSLTGDEVRFCRLARILLDDVSNHLRTLFKDTFKKRYQCAWGDNQMSGEFFINKFKRTAGRHSADVIRQGDTGKFDLTVLFTCLLYSETGILDPRTRDKINELRKMRNAWFAHSLSSTLSAADFKQISTSLITIYVQLQWNPTVLRQAVADAVITAECARPQQQLDIKRQRDVALDGSVQMLKGMWSQLYSYLS